MPVHKTPGGGWQDGTRGKVYKGKGARQKALRQNAARHARQNARPGRSGSTKSGGRRK